MSEYSPAVAEPENPKDVLGLLERLDPAIGEATSVFGAMLTELLRRTLRGGVARIGDEMHGHVSDKVDTVIAERKPALEQLAAEVADHAARTAATEVATEEVHVLEQRTQASDLELADKITQTAQTAEQRTRESAAALIAQIKESEQRGQAALHEKIQTLIDRSREGSDRLKARLAEQDKLIVSLGKQLESMSKDLVRMLQESHSELSEALHMLKQGQQSLAARVAELEKPRGLRALWLRLFGRRKATPAEPAVAA
jgi:DNA anti-recombination protein RmuC